MACINHCFVLYVFLRIPQLLLRSVVIKWYIAHFVLYTVLKLLVKGTFWYNNSVKKRLVIRFLITASIVLDLCFISESTNFILFSWISQFYFCYIEIAFDIWLTLELVFSGHQWKRQHDAFLKIGGDEIIVGITWNCGNDTSFSAMLMLNKHL